jgi:hypothetical protein
MLKTYNSRFEEPTGLPPERDEDMEINLVEGSNIPKWRSIGKLSQEELAQLKKQIQEMVERGHIRPSTSPYGAAILFVKKPDGSLRMCIDYRGLNDITIKNRCPIPNIEEMRERVAGATVFSKMDLRDGFYNLRVKDSDSHKTAFRCRYGHYEFRVVPMGLSNSPAVFSAMMNRIFGKYMDVFVITYLDDLVIYSKSEAEHLIHLEKIFQLMAQHELFVKRKKCTFMVDKVDFCGHSVTKDGVCISQDKIAAMAAFPVIHNVHDVRSYIGSCVWFARFIPDYASICQPLTKLIRKGQAWTWGAEQIEAIQILQHLITTAPVMRHFNADLPTEVFTDASDYGIGGWIAQRHYDGWHPVTYWSRKLTPAELNYTVHEKELLALVDMIDHHKHWLMGLNFTILTDHKSIEFLQTQPKLNRRQVRWVIALQEYDMTIKYFPGDQNTVADILSRSVLLQPLCLKCKNKIQVSEINSGVKNVDKSLSKLITQGMTWKQRIVNAGADDPFWCQLESWTKDPSSVPSNKTDLVKLFHKRNGLWSYMFYQIYIPRALRSELLHKYHDTEIAGHQGAIKTLELLQRKYYWPAMAAEVAHYVRTCDTCQRTKGYNGLKTGKLQPLPVPKERFIDIAIDFFTIHGFKSGPDTVMIIVDRLTKFTVLVPCYKTDNAQTIAKLLLSHWFCKGLGLPKTITSDRDSKFTSELWIQLCAALGIKQTMSTSHHQQTDGQAEIGVRNTRKILGTMKIVDNNWVEKLPAAEFAINNAESSSTGYSPFYLAFGRNPIAFPEEMDLIASEGELNWLHELNNTISEARLNLQDSRTRQKQYADKHRFEAPTYVKNQLVLVAAAGIVWPDKQKKPSKILDNYFGPCRVLDGPDDTGLNYLIELPAEIKRVHPWIHVDRLTIYHRPKDSFPERIDEDRPAPKITDKGAEYEIESIKDVKVKRLNRAWVFSYLLKWKGYSDQFNLWEDFVPGDGTWTDEDLKLVKDYNPVLYKAAIEGRAKDFVSTEDDSSMGKGRTSCRKDQKRQGTQGSRHH